mmetsp:Transcript_9349/g.9166  ORF Transcript_9349/g.9166 Transcript_9349/m.9166 type:complete len:167 (+) Transcript_9349:564-1064(+)
MGCNASMVDKQGITSGKSDNELAVKYFSSSEDNRVDDTAKRNEEKIELIFKSKRENVYTAGVSLDNRINYHPKNIKKSSGQSKLIRDALDQNFVFASLDNIEKQMLANAMEQISVSEGTHVYTPYPLTPNPLLYYHCRHCQWHSKVWLVRWGGRPWRPGGSRTHGG